MKRYLIIGFISVYLSTLVWGVVANTLSFGVNSHPMMYMIVWDMFCGWSAYDYRHHLVAEGTDGEYYAVEPAPWGTIYPYGNLPRHQYDYTANFTNEFVKHVLSKTDHVPINRVLLIEETWAKKYNILDHLYSWSYGKEKDIHKYYNLQAVISPEGENVARNYNFINAVSSTQVMENPKIRTMMQSSRPFYEVRVGQRMQPINYSENDYLPR
jgi:hypothetical protein